MTDTRINLLGGEFAGRALKATAETRTNLYLDVPADGGDAARIVAYGTPGLERFSFLAGGGYIHAAQFWPDKPGLLTAWTKADATQSVGVVTTTGTIQLVPGLSFPMAANAQAYFATYQLRALVAGGTGHAVVIDASGPFMTFTEVALFLNHPSWCCYLAGRFVMPYVEASLGSFTWSALLDPMTWPAGISTAESSSDALVRGIAWRGILVLFGQTTTEFWQPTGQDDPPFQVISGAVGNYGCVSAKSVQVVGDTVVFAALMAQGNKSICLLDGYNARPISTPDIDYLLGQGTTVLHSSGYRVSGHDFYEVTFSSATDPVTYLYDITAGVWSLKRSPGLTCSQITCAAPFLDPFGHHVVAAGTSHGTVCRVLPGTYTEPDAAAVDTALSRELVLPHIYDRDGFNQMRIAKLRLDAEGGDVVGGKPTIDLSISRDGGRNYGSPMNRHFASDADFGFRAEWRRLGIARDWVLKLSMQNDCKTALVNAFIDVDKADN